MERTSELSGVPVELFADIPPMPAVLAWEHSVGSLGELSHALPSERELCRRQIRRRLAAFPFTQGSLSLVRYTAMKTSKIDNSTFPTLT